MNIVGPMRMSVLELTYQRQQFYESQALNGVLCTVHTIGGTHEETHDFYGDVSDEITSYSSKFTTYITFDTHPTIKTLKSLGWYIDNNTLPILAYIPVIYGDDQNRKQYTPQIDDRIILPADRTLYQDVVRDEESFLIKKLVGQGYPDVVYYVANLVPYRRDAQ